MKLLSGFRILVFGVQNFMPIITTQWSTIVLPVILRRNLKITDETRFSLIAGYFYISYFTGMIVGCFLWPNLIKLISKRNCIFMSMLIIGTANILSGIGEHVVTICAFRFIAGCALNIHTVGKDFLFEFAEDKYRQFALSLDSCFGLLAHLAGPYIGMHIYLANDQSFEASCIWIGGIFYIGAMLFFVAFYLIHYRPVDHVKEVLSDSSEEEARRLAEENEQAEMIQATTAKEVLIECIKNPDIRNAMLTFGISTACTNCDLVLSVIFLQTPWNEDGLSISPHVLSRVSLISYIPALTILLYSPTICPRRIPYHTFIRFFVIVFALAVFLTPTFRDLLPENGHERLNVLIYINQAVKYSMNSHIFSPFIHYKINQRANRHIRTTINAINFVFSTTSIVVIMNIIVPLLSVSLYSPTFTEFRPFNKYIAFVLVSILQFSCFFLIAKRRDKGFALDKTETEWG